MIENRNLYKEAFSENLKSVMRQMCWTQTNLSKVTKIPQSSLSQYISGRSLPTLGTVIIMCQAMHIDYDTLMIPWSGIKFDEHDTDVLKTEYKWTQYFFKVVLPKEMASIADPRYKVSQLQLAEESGINQGYISRLLLGRIMPDVHTMLKIAKVFAYEDNYKEFFNPNEYYLYIE